MLRTSSALVSPDYRQDYKKESKKQFFNNLNKSFRKNSLQLFFTQHMKKIIRIWFTDLKKYHG